MTGSPDAQWLEWGPYSSCQPYGMKCYKTKTRSCSIDIGCVGAFEQAVECTCDGVPQIQPAGGPCAVSGSNRVDCGVPGITRSMCEQSGCCFDSSSLDSYWCYRKLLNVFRNVWLDIEWDSLSIAFDTIPTFRVDPNESEYESRSSKITSGLRLAVGENMTIEKWIRLVCVWEKEKTIFQLWGNSVSVAITGFFLQTSELPLSASRLSWVTERAIESFNIYCSLMIQYMCLIHAT